jgi:hypothetical protein
MIAFLGVFDGNFARIIGRPAAELRAHPVGTGDVTEEEG